MTNENCLEGIKCPQCGNEDRFMIAATVIAEVTDDGADVASPLYGNGFEWDDNSHTTCPDCGKVGALSAFTANSKPLASSASEGELAAVLEAVCREIDKLISELEAEIISAKDSDECYGWNSGILFAISAIRRHADLLTENARRHPRGSGWAGVRDKVKAALAQAKAGTA